MLQAKTNANNKVCAIATFCMLSCFWHCPQSQAASWSDISRQACVEASLKNYAKASQLYESAIEHIRQEAPGAETVYDLYLNLAATYRLAGDLNQAKRVLELCQPLTKSGNWDDPVLPARYWRRLASVAETDHNLEAAVDAYAHALNLSYRLFDQSAPSVVNHSSKFLTLLAQACLAAPSGEQILTLIHSVSQLAPEAKTVRAQAVRILLARVRQGLAQGSVQDTPSLLAALTMLDSDKQACFYLWQVFLTKPGQSNPDSRFDQVVPALKLLQTMPNSSPSEKFVIHIFLARSYLLAGKPAESDTEVSAARALGKPLDWWTWPFVNQYCSLCLSLALPVPKQVELLKPNCRMLLSQTCALTDHYWRTATGARKRQLAEPLAYYRIAYARLLALLSKMDEAENTLDSVSTDRLIETTDEDLLTRYVLVTASLARKRLQSGDQEKADKQFAKALQLTKGFKSVSRQKEMQQWIRLADNKNVPDSVIDSSQPARYSRKP